MQAVGSTYSFHRFFMQSQLVFERFEKAHLRTLRKQLLHSGYAGGANPERRGEASREGICPGKVFEILHKNCTFWCFFGAVCLIFLWRKDTFAPVFFYWNDHPFGPRTSPGSTAKNRTPSLDCADVDPTSAVRYQMTKWQTVLSSNNVVIHICVLVR